MQYAMTFDVGTVQEYLKQAKIDGWLIYDFFNLNKVAGRIFDFSGRMITRRWFYFIPSQGEPTLVLHKIESANFPPVPGHTLLYSGWEELNTSLQRILDGAGKIAMEYSPRNEIPTVSFVDAGTFELIRDLVPEVVSSANLVQYFSCRLRPAQLASHRKAAKVLHLTQQAAFALVEKKLQQQQSVTEFDIQTFIMQSLAENDLISQAPAIVAVNENASNPHYIPTAETCAEIKAGDCLLIDLWAKEQAGGAVYADITWVGFAGKKPPQRYVEIWEIARDARDRGVALLRENHKAGKVTRGFEVDEVVRQYIAGKGYGDYFFHRTGHSIDEDDHGKGVNIDSFETRDFREIIPGLLFSIEPGIYLPEFGVRTEIDVYYSEKGPQIFTPAQEHLVLLDL